MALRQRNFFFDPTNTDRFNSQDIPTEQTMSDWCDSVPFIKETTDRAQITRAGIAKTTSDAKINAGDNTDAAGVSPLGFTTFVRPAQIPKILDSASVTWSKVPRGGATSTDTGVGIEDWQASVNFPAPINQDADQITTTEELELTELIGTVCNDLSTVSSILPSGTELQVVLNQLQDSIRSITDRFTAVAARACEAEQTQVALGDVILTVTPPNYWGTNWAEPEGQPLLIADHPQLYALFLNTYGSAAPGYFRIPDLVQQQNYLKVQKTSGGLLTVINGGQAIRTLGDTDMPDHTHTVTGTATGGEHDHTFLIYAGDTGVVVVDGNGGDDITPPPQNFTTPTGGAHTHTVTGTTNTYGETSPNPVWNTATNVTPRYTNFFLKMRVK